MLASTLIQYTRLPHLISIEANLHFNTHAVRCTPPASTEDGIHFYDLSVLLLRRCFMRGFCARERKRTSERPPWSNPACVCVWVCVSCQCCSFAELCLSGGVTRDPVCVDLRRICLCSAACGRSHPLRSGCLCSAASEGKSQGSLKSISPPTVMGDTQNSPNYVCLSVSTEKDRDMAREKEKVRERERESE